MKKLILILAIIAVGATNSFSANNVQGIVWGKDPDGTRNKLSRATIKWLETAVGTYTDKDGKFKIPFIEKVKKLVISSVGYKPDTITVSGSTSDLEIELESGLVGQEVVVAGSVSGNMISKSSIQKSENITSHGLKKAACCSLGESFQTNPSVDVNYSDAVSGAKQIQLLGLHGSYVQMLTEKVPSMRGLASTFGLNYVPGPWMESIQISKGSASVAEGYESITGQINLEYKKPQGGDPLYLNIYGNKAGMFEFNGLSAYEFTDKIGTNLLVHANYNNLEEDHNNDSFLDHPLVKQLNIMDRFVYESGMFEGRITGSALIEERRGGQKGYFDNPNGGLYGMKINTQRYQFQAKNGAIFSDEPFNSVGTIFAATYHHQGAFYGNKNYDGTEQSIFANVLYQREWAEHHQTIVGASFLYDNYREQYDTANFDRKENVPGVYAEYTMTAIPALSLIGGVRADFHNDFGTYVTPRFHLRYELIEGTVLRASAGKGWKTQNILAEYPQVFVSSRKMFIDGKIRPDEAWNYGVNITSDFKIDKIPFTVNAEYYRTDFMNQMIADFDKSATEVHFYNLVGNSYSNSYQLDVNFKPFKRFDVTAAYRLNDVKMTVNGELVDKPLVSRQKAFINLAYATNLNEWMFDFTADWSSGGRLHNSSDLPSDLRPENKFPAFWILNAQITKKFDDIEVYIGGENLTDFTQHHAIIDSAHPFGKYFDSSYMWGPLTGANFYIGVRWNVL